MHNSTLAVLAFGLLAPCLLAQVTNEVEPNDSPAQATAVGCGLHVEGIVNYAGDLDWYSFTMANAGRVQLVAGTGRDSVLTDTVMELHANNATLDLIAVNDDEDRSWMSAISAWLPAGNYVVMVRGYGNDTGPYSLDLQCDPNGAPDVRVAEGAEPNGPLGVGTPTPIALGALGEGSLGTGDSDWWSFVVTAPTAVRIETGRGLSGSTSNDTILYLRDATGAQLEFDDDDAPGAWSLITATLQPGAYFADVQGYGGANAGTYTLRLDQLDASVTLAESPEPNGDPLISGSPSVFGCGVPGLGEITAGDSDWWQFQLTADTFVDLTVWGGEYTATGLPIQNSVLNLYDTSSTLLATDNDDYYDRLSRLSIWLPAGNYYAEVVGSNATQAGTYLVRLTCNDSALYHNFAGGCVGSNQLAPRWNVRDWELPMLGTTMVADLGNCPGSTLVIPFAGFSRTLASNQLPLPYSLQALGAPGCMIEVDPLITGLMITDAQGRAVSAFAIPMALGLSGIEFSQQALVLDAAANTLGWTVSNAGTGLITARR
ncbi:MAG: PPC domain-containing protein [Planctomycetes bacterium]|nr:PPC domain-containing protein [Planctomycetota bacterium]MCB9886141.1 PPC domain-containing protein [Planctomycetota bacterium]